MSTKTRRFATITLFFERIGSWFARAWKGAALGLIRKAIELDSLREKKERKTMKTKHLLIALVPLAALLLVGCSPKDALVPVVPEGAQAGDLVDLQPCTYEANKVEYDADCGTLVVPENRSDPDSRLIALPVIRVRALSDSPAEPIFFLQGGPGGSNMHFQYLEGLVDRHDFVQVGYRGVDGSVVLDCPEISEAIRNAPGDLLSDAALESYAEASTRCAGRLQAEGVDLAGYTITETIDDMEDARVALGYERINLLGESYGTRVEMIYEWMYPQSLHRVIIVAVNPPGHFLWEPEDIDAQIEDYAELCARDTECRARTDDLAASMRHVSENMPDRWLFIPIDKGGVKALTFVMFMESIQPPGAPVPLSAPAAIDMWLAAEKGDASGMALLSIGRDLFLPNLWVFGDFLSKGGSVDDYYDPARDYRTELNPPDSILGSPWSLFIWGMLHGWPNTLIPEEYLQVQPTDVETLLISGSIDFSTPPQFATEELLPHLSNGEQVILKDFGHTETFWNSQPEARAHMLNTFFSTGEVDASLYTYQPVNFHAGLGWPGLAKILVAVVVLVPILLLVLVWLIIRGVKRRKASQVSS
ncbi:MAG: alpha/beta fold hydrolase [Anaerolineae bacterium]|nr:alpha/beta fold hydrolase [Anaerolineae bacterium]